MMRTMRRYSIAAAASAWILAAHADASACPLTVGFAARQATGSHHGYREYVAYVDGKMSDDTAITFELALANRMVRVDAPASRALLFVVPREDATSVRIVAVDGNGSASPGSCAASTPFAFRPTKLTREFFFDDEAKWIDQSGVTALPFDGPAMATILLNDFTVKARRRGLQGAAHVVVAIGPDGVVLDAEVFDPSGSVDLDDLAMEAALSLRFTAARLPAKAGGGAIGGVDDVTLTFTPGMTSANAH